jgi:hypothetical protein
VIKYLFELPLAQEWHPTKNADMNLALVTQGTSIKVWWLGSCGHEWEAQVSNRVNGSGCLFCSNQRVLAGFNDLSFKRPDVAEEWHPTLNGSLLPTEVIAGTDRKAWWLGRACGHEWEATISSRSGNRNIGCPFCSYQLVLVGFNDLASQNKELSSQWHPTLNGNLTAQDILATSNKKVWWICAEDHGWEAPVSRRLQGSYCTFCTNMKVLVGFNDLATTYPDLAKEWHPIKNGVLTAQEIIAGTPKKLWWLGNCGHEWQTTGAARVNGSGCPVCIGHITLPGFNDLAFLKPELAAEWHPTKNGDLLPSMVTLGSNKRVWWICSTCGYEWDTFLGGRTGSSSGCPQCAKSFSRKELALYEYVSTLGFEVKQSNRKIITPKELDMYIPEKNVAIEFNGVFWHSEEQGKDKYYHYNKWLACKDKGIQLLQFWEDDWDRNPELIKRMVAHKLGVSQQIRISGHATKFVEVSEAVAKVFLTENHLQGYATAKYFGLEYNGEIVAMIGLRYFKEDKGLEITRFAASANILGGFSKLLKNSVPLYPEAKVIHSYSHNDHATGGVYEANGFTKKHEGKPGYSYVVSKIKRVNRLSYTKAKFKSNPALKYEDGLTERGLATLNNLTRAWDAGSTLWVKEIS